MRSRWVRSASWRSLNFTGGRCCSPSPGAGSSASRRVPRKDPIVRTERILKFAAVAGLVVGALALAEPALAQIATGPVAQAAPGAAQTSGALTQALNEVSGNG